MLALLVVVAVVVWRRRSAQPPVAYDVNDRPVGELALSPLEVQLADGDTLALEQGQLVVPERHDSPGGRHILLTYARLASTAAHPRAPIVVLAGGPGVSGIALLFGPNAPLYRALQSVADVILLDQRGTGRSIPNLQCHNSLDLPTGPDENSPPEILAHIADRARECADGFRAHGVDLAAYNSEENADDIEALRLALGAERITLLGHSYGTELAMVYARRHPDAVERMILMGVVSPDLSLKLPSEVEGEFDRLSVLARNDSTLHGAVPDLAGLMRGVHEGLGRHPRAIAIPLMDAVDANDPAFVRAIFRIRSVFQPYWKMTLTRLDLELMMQDRIGGDGWLGWFPQGYARMAAGDYREVGNLLRNFRRRSMPNLLLFTTNCATGATPERMAAAAADTVGTIFTPAALSFGRSPEFCAAAGLRSAPDAFREPIRSTRPVMLVGGTLDGRTPVEHFPEFEQRFPDHVSIVVDNAAHTNLLDPDVQSAIVAFVAGEPVPPVMSGREVQFEPLPAPAAGPR